MKLTPNIIDVMLHFYVTEEPHPRRTAPAVEEAIDLLFRHEMIQKIPDSERYGNYRATGKGEAFVDMLCSTPFPVLQYVDPRTIK